MINQSSQTYRLRWNKESSAEFSLSESFKELRDNSEFFDVSIGCSLKGGGARTLRAHKMILASYSNVFKEILREHPNKTDPMIYLSAISFLELSCILEFMYNGEVNINQSNLKSFLAIAAELQIKGLQPDQNSDQKSSGLKRPRPMESSGSFSNSSSKYETLEKYMHQDKLDTKRFLKEERRPPLKLVKRENIIQSDNIQIRQPVSVDINDESDGEAIADGQIGNIEDFIKNIDKSFISGGQKRTISVCRLCRKEFRRDRIRKHIKGVHKDHLNEQEYISNATAVEIPYERYEMEESEHQESQEDENSGDNWIKVE